jgi:hypothetical protein
MEPLIDLDVAVPAGSGGHPRWRRFRLAKVSLLAACVLAVVGVLAGAGAVVAIPRLHRTSVLSRHADAVVLAYIGGLLTMNRVQGGIASFTGQMTIVNQTADPVRFLGLRAQNAVLTLRNSPAQFWISVGAAASVDVRVDLRCGAIDPDLRLRGQLDAVALQGDVLNVPDSVEIDARGWSDFFDLACLPGK